MPASARRAAVGSAGPRRDRPQPGSATGLLTTSLDIALHELLRVLLEDLVDLVQQIVQLLGKLLTLLRQLGVADALFLVFVFARLRRLRVGFGLPRRLRHDRVTSSGPALPERASGVPGENRQGATDWAHRRVRRSRTALLYPVSRTRLFTRTACDPAARRPGE